MNPPRPSGPGPRLRRARPCLLSLSVALAAGTLAGCGDDAPPSASTAAAEARKARAVTAEAMALVASYPVRDVFVALEPPARGGMPTPRRTDAEALVRAREIAGRLRAPGASFAEIAAEMSDDPGTAANEGFVGFVSRATGQDPLLVAKAASLKEGEISDPFPGRGGLHVTQRLTREEGKAIEARVFVPYEGLLLPSGSHLRGLPETQTDAWVRNEAMRLLGVLRGGGATLEELAEPIQGARVLRDVSRGNARPGFEAFARALRAAEPGTWIDPVETPDGFTVVRRVPYVRAAARGLVITHVGTVASRRVSPRLTEAAESLARAAKARLDQDPGSWDRVVAELSEEPGTKDVGGFLGDVANTTPGRQPPEIERVILGLAPGQTSDVVHTRFGFHIFRRVD